MREGLVKYLEGVMAHEVQLHVGLKPYERSEEREDYGGNFLCLKLISFFLKWGRLLERIA